MRKFAIVVLVASGMSISATDLMAQGRGRGGGGFGGRGGGPLGLLQQAGVDKEIMLVDDQKEEIEKIQTAYRESMRTAMQEARDSGDRGQIRDVMNEKRKEMEEQMNGVLLPHQVERLEQLSVQSRIQRSGADGALESTEIRERLNLTDDQLKEIQEIASESQAELQKKVAELQKQARKKVLGALTPKQQQMWEELVGGEFEFAERTRGGRRARGGQQQGAGRTGRRGNRGETNRDQAEE